MGGGAAPTLQLLILFHFLFLLPLCDCNRRYLDFLTGGVRSLSTNLVKCSSKKTLHLPVHTCKVNEHFT